MPNERTSLLSHGASTEKPSTSWLPCIISACAVIVFSAGLINFNKALMEDDVFPFPVALILVHSAVGTILSFILLVTMPSLFPAMTDDLKKVDISWRFLGKSVLPVAFCFACQLLLSNSAYRYASVPFLQMLKESNVVLVYIISLLVGMEVFNGRVAVVLLGVVGATVLTVHGELNFSSIGFGLQGSSCICEATKIVIQGVLLSGGGKKLDPMTFVLLVSPMCVLMLVLFIACSAMAGLTNIVDIPRVVDITGHAGILLANALVAFGLNIAIAAFMKYGSAIAYVLVGILKDACIVLVSSLFLHGEISGMQILGFSCQLPLLFIYSMLKTFNEQIDKHGLVEGAARVLYGDPKSKIQPPENDEEKNANVKNEQAKLESDNSKPIPSSYGGN